MQQNAQRIRVLVAEDNRDLCDVVCALIDAEPDMQIVGATEHARQVLEVARSEHASVVVLDLNLSGESSVPAMQSIRSELPSVGVVVYSGYDRCDLDGALPDHGSVEYVSKTGEAGALLTAIRRVAKAAAGAGN